MAYDEDRVRGMAFWLHRNNLHRFYICPECCWVSPGPKELGEHLERHREAYDDGGLPCPKGCGRAFERSRGSKNGYPKELRDHVRLCNGEHPLESETGPKTPKFVPVLVLQITHRYVSTVIHEGQEVSTVQRTESTEGREGLVFGEMRSDNGDHRLRLLRRVGGGIKDSSKVEGREENMDGDEEDVLVDYP